MKGKKEEVFWADACATSPWILSAEVNRLINYNVNLIRFNEPCINILVREMSLSALTFFFNLLLTHRKNIYLNLHIDEVTLFCVNIFLIKYHLNYTAIFVLFYLELALNRYLWAVFIVRSYFKIVSNVLRYTLSD